MKKYLIIITIFTLPLISCTKSDETQALPNPSIQLEEDVKVISQYIFNNKLSVTNLSPTGIYYHISDSGNLKIRPTPSSIIKVRYMGQLLNGKIFIQQDSVKFALRYAMPGFRLGLPLIGNGGKIRLILPSGYAYDRQGSNNKLVAPNEVVDFNIELLDVQ